VHIGRAMTVSKTSSFVNQYFEIVTEADACSGVVDPTQRYEEFRILRVSSFENSK